MPGDKNQQWAPRVALLALWCLGLLIVAALHPDEAQRRSPFDVLTVGLLLGTMYGHVSVAAAWCALGPLRLASRLPWSCGWVAALCIALAVNLATDHDPQNELIVVLVIGGLMFGQWLLAQVPLWLWTYGFPGRMVVGNESVPAGPGDSQQFGIRQVLVLTTIVAVVLGSGRVTLGSLKSGDGQGAWEMFLMFGFLALSNAIMSLPILAAALAARRVLFTAGGMAALLVFVTACEVPIMRLTGWGPTPLSEMTAVIAVMNFFQAGWIFALVLLAKAAGCRWVAA